MNGQYRNIQSGGAPMICEMCGKDVNELVLVEVEGAFLKVCKSCARMGKEMKRPSRAAETHSPATPALRRRSSPPDIFERMTKEVVEDYPQRIRRAREALGLSQEDLARKINEKKSIIAKLESGHIYPPDKLVKKLEKALGIELMEEVPSD
ncbi:MAG: TIGR00270 family protein [Thermoplasmata archaeon]|nr:MAG: TIGR00270 family protein [Thermoplasmata archaeon]RLF73132.1 MAG: TIGR00270 family protein [Thermoplasmata archaeon]RLF75909.1 MAG: TIGR00270 family protein [Thermoplasmata archaeon]HDD60892.1 TIGR00270 family protein [Euryarchaeota archaeon]